MASTDIIPPKRGEHFTKVISRVSSSKYNIGTAEGRVHKATTFGMKEEEAHHFVFAKPIFSELNLVDYCIL